MEISNVLPTCLGLVVVIIAVVFIINFLLKEIKNKNINVRIWLLIVAALYLLMGIFSIIQGIYYEKVYYYYGGFFIIISVIVFIYCRRGKKKK